MLGPARGAFRRLPSLRGARGLPRAAQLEADAGPQGLSLSGRAFMHSGPSILRHSRASPWQRQATAQLTSYSATAQANAAAALSEGQMVEEWLLSLQLVDQEAREVATELLHRNPVLLYADAQRVVQTVQVLVNAVRAKSLLRPWFMSDAQILSIIERYTPDTLRARLSELHRVVWQRLDSDDVGAHFSSRSSLDLLDLDARALANKAQKLRELVPEFLPSTVLRSCPELLDVQSEDLPRFVHRAGDVVVIGRNVRVELQAPANVVAVFSKPPPVGRTQLLASLLPAKAAAAAAASAAAPQLLHTLSNTRALVYADGECADIRYADPCKVEQAAMAEAIASAPPPLPASRAWWATPAPAGEQAAFAL